ncbi:hypothetical protein NM208_g10337 [Fusarium decemcellulare]|uniref:Uncharacterized protein n=1 Tax=Fusarium decemcellulare TaxID=57161 RepID=A0ACC1RY95_9HYPO|nr:hypothetical protein NM208_g10337 [Fusarium decemcellulare]
MKQSTRCWTINGTDNGIDELKLGSVPVPQLGEHDVLVRMRGASLNYRDLVIAAGKYPFRHKERVIAASDGAGDVIETGAKVTRWRAGDKVVTLFNQAHQTEPIDSAAAMSGLGGAIDGTLTEYGVFNETGLVRLPSNLNYIEGATLSCAGLTSWNALYGLKPVKSGDTVLVQGTGGVSLFGLQFAKAAGATVIATTSSANKAKFLSQLGADYVINYKTDGNWGETARNLTPDSRGVDHILQAGGPGTMPQSLQAIRFEGIIHVIGAINYLDQTFPPDSVTVSDILVHMCVMRGFLVGSRRQMEDMIRAVEADNIHPVIDEEIFPFEKAKEAYDAIQTGEEVQTSYPPYPPATNAAPDKRIEGAAVAGQVLVKRQEESTVSGVLGLDPSQSEETLRPGQAVAGRANQGDDVVGNASPVSNQEVQSQQPLWMNSRSSDDDISRMLYNDFSPGPDVVYCFYPFLVVNNLHNIPQEDVNFLEHQGCLRVPMRPLLDELVREYFLHVHPILPLICEGDFWDMYYHNDDQSSQPRVSLLFLQSMMFACCNFASASTMKSLGFSTIRSMRATFYRRAKLLYDLGAETSHLILAQSAVLLSFALFSSAKKPNTSWLNTAFENAQYAEAHLYETMEVISPEDADRRAALKRLWWCCVIRDRTSALLMRRSIKITRDHFAFDTVPLNSADLECEFDRSRVYDFRTKKSLADVFSHSVRLYLILTDVLMLCFPLDGTQGWKQQAKAEDSQRLNGCREALQRWYTYAISNFPEDQCRVLETGASNQDQTTAHPSIMLYRNLMLMHFHASRAILCHYEILHLNVLRGEYESMTKDLATIFGNRTELHDAASGITACVEQLVDLGVSRWLPITAIGCTVLPLLLNILDIKLSPPKKDNFTGYEGTSAQRQHQLNVLIGVMKTWQPQYDGVDWITEIVRHIVELAQLDDPIVERNSSAIDWTDILAFQPGSYLRLALTLDFSLCKGRLPRDGDFPHSLRGLFMVGQSPINNIVSATPSALTMPAPSSGTDIQDDIKGGSASQDPSVFNPDNMFGDQDYLYAALSQLADGGFSFCHDVDKADGTENVAQLDNNSASHDGQGRVKQ